MNLNVNASNTGNQVQPNFGMAFYESASINRELGKHAQEAVDIARRGIQDIADKGYDIFLTAERTSSTAPSATNFSMIVRKNLVPTNNIFKKLYRMLTVPIVTERIPAKLNATDKMAIDLENGAKRLVNEYNKKFK